MPYIASEERPAIDAKVGALAEEISEALAEGGNKDTDVSVQYRRKLLAVCKVLLQLERRGRARMPPRRRSDPASGLALEIFGQGGRATYRGEWLGRLNYGLTRLIQVVPQKMVENGVWKEEFRYWIYAQTVGALARTAVEVHALGDDWPTDGLVGVLVDVKDEYKRRVNAAYETFQILKTGDCYTTRYRSDVSEVKDEAGEVVGYAQVMKHL